MTATKRGPKTLVGKEKSSKNSVTHGLRSEKVATPVEKIHYDDFLKELIEFYKPAGPIEHLQLERLATCKAKLKSLYELEQAKQELLMKDHESGTKKYIEGMTYLEPLVRGMMKELFSLKKVFLPCKLEIDLLTQLVLEIEAFTGKLSSDDDITEYFPHLVSYLEGIDSSEKSLHGKLIAIGNQLQAVIDGGDNYLEGLKVLFADRFEKKEPEPTAEDLEFDRVLAEYQETSRLRRGEKPKATIKITQEIFPDAKKITTAFISFKKIQEAYLKTFQEVDGVRSKIELHKRALSLPMEEADLLMRYQTMWERRLSTLIGEFMQLQRTRLLNA